MKVIGKSEGGYLISATEGEIANMFGFYWAGEDGYKAALKEQGKDRSSDLVGLQINISTAYNRLSWLERRNSEFEGLCTKLRDTANAIEDHRPLFDKIVDGKVA